VGARPSDRPAFRLRGRRRATIWFLCFVVACIASAIAIAIAVRANRTPHAAPATIRPARGNYSSPFLRQGAPWSSSDESRLAHYVRSIVNGGGFPANTGAVFLDARSGRVLYDHNARRSLIPASTIKAIVAAAALRDLGPAYRFVTAIATDGTVAGGAVNGNLYLIGGGDPELAGHDLRAAVHELKRLGIGAVHGAVVADGSLYGADSVNRTWDPDDLEYGWAAPPSALSIDNGAIQFTITPDPGGGLALIETEPTDAAGRLTGGVRTGGPYDENTLRIDPLADGTGFALSGHIPYGAPQKYWRSIARPTRVAAIVLHSMLVQAGVSVSGPPSVARTPAGVTMLWSHRSRPLAAIVHKMAVDSDNHIAEQLLRAVGAQQSIVGTLENGIAEEYRFLASLGSEYPGTVIADGSGLSPANRVSAAALAAALRSMLAGPDAGSVPTLLPRVGIEGTVRRRTLAPDVAGRVFGKDGYIDRASGLAGFVETAHHGIVVYAFLVDDWERGLDAVWDGEDDILTRVARM
jgi:D-alanyl-D-alanine carboxypeptidase/D-alanyl-D-alanine-endopeptidase (penicillin-binding protein 4)